MAFIYNLSDTWNDAATTWNGIKLAVTNSGSDSSSKLLNLTVTGASTASFVVDKSGNLVLNGSVNKITMTAPATGATLTLADNSTFVTSGAYSSTFTFTGTTTLTFPTSGTVTALGNSTTGSGSIVLATGPSITLTNATGLPLATGVTGTLPIANGGTGQTTANAAFNALVPSQTGNNGKYLTTDGSNTSWATNPLGTVTSVDVSGGSTGLSFSGGPITTSGTITMAGTLAAANGGTGLTSLGTGIATWLGTPSSANLASAVTDETGSGPLVFATSPTFTSQVTFGTASSTRGTLVLANTSANTVTLQSSNTTAANYTLTFPAAAPVNGYYLQTDTNGVLSWAAGGGGGGGSPGGSNTQVQFNNAGTFGGDAAFTFVNGTGTATMSLGVASTTSAALKLYNSSSANAVTVASGNNTAAWTLTLPPDDGTANQFLQTDGSGNTIWAAAAAGTINTATIGQITYYSGTNTLSGTTTGAGILTFLGTPSSANLAAAVTDETGSGSLVFGTSPTITTPTISGNETHTGTGALFLADFSNATVASRFAFQSSTTNGTTGIYALPNGNSTGAAWQATNNSDPTNASKIMITTNANTDVQLVSGINGSGTYLPLSIYTDGGKSAEFSTTKGTFTLGVSGSTAGVLNIAGSTSGTVSIRGAAGAGTWTFTVPTSGGVNGYALTTDGSGVTSWGQISLTAGVTGTLPVANGGTGITSFGTGVATWLGTPSSANLAAAVTDETGSGSLVFGTSPTLSNPTVTNYVETYYNIGTVGASTTIDLVNGTFQNLTLTSATALTVTMPTATAGKSFILIVRQPASGTATTVTFTSVKWPASTAPTITATLSRADIIAFFSDGTNWYGSAVQNFTP
jgi:hypothetical protein